MPTPRSYIIGTTAPAGSGKSFRRCAHYLYNEFLPLKHGVHYSNFPIHREVLAAAVAKKTGETPDDVLERVQVIPDEILKSWRAGDSGPWDYFADVNLDGCRLAIDEFHKYCSAHSKKSWRQQWGEWFGEIRHRNACVEIISQSPRKVAKEVWDEAGSRLVINNGENRRDPYFHILMGDWYELKAKFLTGEYVATCWEFEKREVDGKWVEEDSRRFTLDPFYFEFYDSYSRPEGAGDDDAEKVKAPEHEFERRGYVGLLLWFLVRNIGHLWWRLGATAFVVYLLCGGGAPMMGKFLDLVKWCGIQNHVGQKAGTPGAPAAPVVASVVSNVGDVDEGRLRLPDSAGVVGPGRGPAGVRFSGPVVSPTTAPVAQSEVRALQEENDRLRKQLAELQKKFDEMGQVVLVTSGRCTFRDGITYGIGEKIQEGPFVGRRVVSMDQYRAAICLDDGRIVHLARVQ